MEKALEVYDNKNRKIPTSKLNDVMLKAIEAYHAPVVRGQPVKIKYITQLPTQVPSFAFFCNYPDDIKHLIRIISKTSYAQILTLMVSGKNIFQEEIIIIFSCLCC